MSCAEQYEGDRFLFIHFIMNLDVHWCAAAIIGPAENLNRSPGFPIELVILNYWGEQSRMARTIVYWVTTGLIAALSLFAVYSYLTAAPQAVEGFTRVGYPQQLRVILGIAKLLGLIALLVPGFPKLKEWAYAGFAFAWISAFVAHYLVKERPSAFTALGLLVLLAISYVTRPASRQCQGKAAMV
jgi:hypothetical protein